MELDRTLLVFDYLNGEPLGPLDAASPDPVGPSAAAAAFDRDAFLDAGGFDERLFAYWEDVDLVLRLRRGGARCALAAGARGTHEHSATLGSGLGAKELPDRLRPRLRAAQVGGAAPPRLARRPRPRRGRLRRPGGRRPQPGGVRGPVDGYRAARPTEQYPEGLPTGQAPTALGTLRRRLARRRRLRERGASSAERRELRSIAFFHLAETSGPSRSLERELEWQAGLGRLEVVVPEDGDVARRFGEFAGVTVSGHEAIIRPAGPAGLAAALIDFARDVRRFRELIRVQRADLVVVVTAMLPAALIAAGREHVPAVVYCGEIFEQRGMSRSQLVSRRALARLFGNRAAGIAAGSKLVARQFEGMRCPVVEVVYPPVGEEYGWGDGVAARARLGIDPDAPLVVALGSISAGRGQDVLVRAIAEARRVHPEIRCVIAGAPFDRAADREFAARVSALIDELGQRDAVTMPGQVDDVAGLLVAADVFVNPARFDEPFGRAAFEAAMAGAPAVVTRVGAADELFTDGESACSSIPIGPTRSQARSCGFSTTASSVRGSSPGRAGSPSASSPPRSASPDGGAWSRGRWRGASRRAPGCESAALRSVRAASRETSPGGRTAAAVAARGFREGCLARSTASRCARRRSAATAPEPGRGGRGALGPEVAIESSPLSVCDSTVEPQAQHPGEDLRAAVLVEVQTPPRFEPAVSRAAPLERVGGAVAEGGALVLDVVVERAVDVGDLARAPARRARASGRGTAGPGRGGKGSA